MTAAGSPHSETLGSKPARRLPEAYRCPRRLSSVPSAKASTIRPCKQPHTRGKPARPTNTGRQIINTLRSQNDQTTTRPPTKRGPGRNTSVQADHNRTTTAWSARVHYPVLKPPRHTTTNQPHTGTAGHGGHLYADPPPGGRGGQGTQQHAHTRPRRGATTVPRQHARHTQGRPPRHHARHQNDILRRKEVIQPHLPVRLPCYDLVPITSLTLDGSPPRTGQATGFGCCPLS